MHNPFLQSLKQYITGAGPWTEHELLRKLVDDGLLSPDFGRQSIDLFHAHFLAMNALYRLQEFDLRSGFSLRIEATRIEWVRNSHQEQSLVQTADHALRSYYLNWDHFSGATDDTVDQLLDSFWRRFLAQDKKHQALELMELEASVSMDQIKRRYRQLAMQLHPDRGGSDEKLAEINWAYETLKRCYAVPDSRE